MKKVSDTWGRTISVKFYLNKKLKPTVSGGEKYFALYAQVVCKMQVCYFKVTDERFTDRQFKNALKKQAQKEDRTIFLQSLREHIDHDIQLIMKVVNPFGRENFVLKNLPELLRAFDKIALELHAQHGFKQIRENLEKNGYLSLVEIINWEIKYPDVLAFHLEALQTSKAIKQFKIWSNYKPDLDFPAAVELLSEIVHQKGKPPRTTQQQKEFIAELVGANKLHPKAADIAEFTLRAAVEFVGMAIKLTSR